MKSNTNLQSNSIILQSSKSNHINQRQPFYLSIKINQLVFTQASLLKSLIQRWNQDIQLSNNKNNSKTSNNIQISNPNQNQKKAVFYFELFQITSNSQHKISQSIALGQIHHTSSTNKLYQYPIDLTQLYLKPKSPLQSFVYHYSPQLSPQLKLSIHLQLGQNSNQKTFIGQCRLDPNMFIQMFLDQEISCVKDCKKIVKRIDEQKQIDQQVQILFEVVIGRDRLIVEKTLSQCKKGINVMDFKEHIRKILKERQLLQGIQQKHEQQQLQIQSVNAENNQQQQQVKNEQIKVKKTTLNKYMKYLNKHVESQLQYFNPHKQLLQTQVRQLFQQKKLSDKNKKDQRIKQNSSNKQVSNEVNKKVQKKNNTKKGEQFNLGNMIKNRLDDKKWSQILKIVGFIIISVILLYLSMTPSRNVQVLPSQQHQQQYDFNSI